MDELRQQLFDVARGHGANTVTALRAGDAVGCAGWVEALPWLYGAPLLAPDEVVAQRLIAHVVDRAHAIGAKRLRMSASAEERGKRAALVAAGFQPALDFIWFARALRPGEGKRASLPWRRVSWEELDVERYRDVHNDTFAGIPNAPALSREVVEDELSRDHLDRTATAAWVDEAGRYVAFVQVERDPGVEGGRRTIESIGVRAELRGRGVARDILEDVIARVSQEAGELRALIASTNTPSILLHTGLGFQEQSRRTVFERQLPPET
jgi:ribosomal protein S18 acetylase RimI-like enzyme